MSREARPLRFDDVEACVDEIVRRTGKRIVCGIPLGIGKPNALVNALYRRAQQDASLELELVTALSLNPPRGKSELEERFLAPVRRRVWGDYPALAYVEDRAKGVLPANVRVCEFYMQSGSGLHNAHAQQNHICTNYSQVARDLITRGVNLLVQAVALRPEHAQAPLSLSSNPDVSLQILPLLEAADVRCLRVGQVNRKLPWLGRSAAVPEDVFDLLLDAPELDHEPFCVPHEPVDVSAWAIGLRASAFVKDAGTLQVGIGALGDAVCYALELRERQNQTYRGLLDQLGRDAAAQRLGEDAPFSQGLYVASELISHALFALFEAGIVRRRVYEASGPKASPGLPEGVQRGPDTGTCLQGAFFVGPKRFYERLRQLTPDEQALIDMTSVAEVNRVFEDFSHERTQRLHPRFINMTMMATLLGSAVSDQLLDGQVVSGVGGQHEFVSMAHQLPQGRSLLLLRATRSHAGRVESNLVWEYPHCTIPRHQRDVFVTEYGAVDLRAKTDRECIEAMLSIADSRFQSELCERAKRAGKLPHSYRIPEQQRHNTPERVADALREAQRTGLLPTLPFGSDFTPEELELVGRLRSIAAQLGSWSGRAALLRAAAVPPREPSAAQTQKLAFALRHLQLEAPSTPREHLYARLLRAAYRQ